MYGKSGRDLNDIRKSGNVVPDAVKRRSEQGRVQGEGGRRVLRKAQE